MIFGVWWLYFALAVAVGIGSAARLTRLIVSDHWPPVLWFRRHWDRWLAGNDWWLLAACPWCLAPWWTLLVGVWAVLSHLHWTWWAFNGWLAASYLASWLVFHDEDGTPIPEPEGNEY